MKTKRKSKTAWALSLAQAGSIFLHDAQPEKAELAWREAIAADPRCLDAWKMLTNFLALQKRIEEAEECLQRLIRLSPRTAFTLWELADKSAYLSKFEQARELAGEALKAGPDADLKMRIHLLLTQMDMKDEAWGDAIVHLNALLEIDPENLEGLRLRETYHYQIAHLPECLADCRRILAMRGDATLHSQFLYKLNFVGETTPEELYEESRRWNELYALPLASKILRHRNLPEPGRRLKVGYVSSDFRNHAVMKLMPGVFDHYDREQFEVFAYSVFTRWDSTTEYVKNVVDHFVELPLDRDLIAERVRADGIDILVDLAGHTMNVDGYLAFAMKPAPVQCSWMGVLATTGLTTMDYFIGDQFLPLPGTEHLFSEQVYRMPRVHSCFRPMGEAEVLPSPYFKNGYITWGCYNDARKITRQVSQLWAVLLHLHPGSKLILKGQVAGTETGRRRLAGWFLEDGIGPERLEFEGLSAVSDYLASWNRVDIALDPFPYNGGTTTFDALWMGVPVVSLGGRLTVATCSISILSEVGLPVANTGEQYIAIASKLAESIPGNPELRMQLHERMKTSRIMDEKGLTRELEAAFRQMWRKWCASQII